MNQKFEFPNAFDVLFFEKYPQLKAATISLYHTNQNIEQIFSQYSDILSQLEINERNLWLYRAFKYHRGGVAKVLLATFFESAAQNKNSLIDQDALKIVSHFSREGAFEIAIEALMSLDQTPLLGPLYLETLALAIEEDQFETLPLLKAQLEVQRGFHQGEDFEKYFSALLLNFSETQSAVVLFAELFSFITEKPLDFKKLKGCRRVFLENFPTTLRYCSLNQRIKILDYFNQSAKARFSEGFFKTDFSEAYEVIDELEYNTKKKISLNEIYLREGKVNSLKTDFKEAERYVVERLHECLESKIEGPVFPNIPSEEELTETERLAIKLLDISTPNEFTQKTKNIIPEQLLDSITRVARWLTLDLRDHYLTTLLNNTMLWNFLDEDNKNEIARHLEWIRVAVSATIKSEVYEGRFDHAFQAFAIQGQRFLSNLEVAFAPYVYSFALSYNPNLDLIVRDVFYLIKETHFKHEISEHCLYLLAMVANYSWYVDRYQDWLKPIIKSNAGKIRGMIENLADHLPLKERLNYLEAFFQESGDPELFLEWLGKEFTHTIRTYLNWCHETLEAKRFSEPLSNALIEPLTHLEEQAKVEALQQEWYKTEAIEEENDKDLSGTTGEPNVEPAAIVSDAPSGSDTTLPDITIPVPVNEVRIESPIPQTVASIQSGDDQESNEQEMDLTFSESSSLACTEEVGKVVKFENEEVLLEKDKGSDTNPNPQSTTPNLPENPKPEPQPTNSYSKTKMGLALLGGVCFFSGAAYVYYKYKCSSSDETTNEYTHS